MAMVLGVLFALGISYGFLYKSHEIYMETIERAHRAGIAGWRGKFLSFSQVVVVWLLSVGTLVMMFFSSDISRFLLGKEPEKATIMRLPDPSSLNEKTLQSLISFSMVIIYIIFFLCLFWKIQNIIEKRSKTVNQNACIQKELNKNTRSIFEISQKNFNRLFFTVIFGLIFFYILSLMLHKEYWARIIRIEPHDNIIVLTVNYGEWIKENKKASEKMEAFKTQQFYIKKPTAEKALNEAIAINDIELEMRFQGNFWHFEKELFEKHLLRDTSSFKKYRLIDFD